MFALRRRLREWLDPRIDDWWNDDEWISDADESTYVHVVDNDYGASWDAKIYLHAMYRHRRFGIKRCRLIPVSTMYPGNPQFDDVESASIDFRPGAREASTWIGHVCDEH